MGQTQDDKIHGYHTFDSIKYKIGTYTYSLC